MLSAGLGTEWTPGKYLLQNGGEGEEKIEGRNEKEDETERKRERKRKGKRIWEGRRVTKT